MITVVVHWEKITNPVLISPRVKKYCSRCRRFHEKGFFWRLRGKDKGCGITFRKGDLQKSGAGGGQ